MRMEAHFLLSGLDDHHEHAYVAHSTGGFTGEATDARIVVPVRRAARRVSD
jgi:hypothetical protein